jgi:adenine-specific DNA-methyltransferase
MNDDIHETPSATPNFKTELADQLAELIPEAISDGKVDVLKLQELLGSDTADTNERFGLFWPGKKRALRAAQEPTTATLKPDFENSKDWDTTKNIFIEGDNLEVLKVLQKHYHAKIKMIYIDPPYNTGKDFVYPDNYKEGLETYLEWTKQVNEEGKRVSTNSDTEGRYHSNWLNMMYPRLKLARNLLTEDGVLVVHIDEHEQANLEKLLNEVFGESSNLGTIVWDKRNPKGDAVGVSQQHETIMLYCRNRQLFGEIGDLSRPKANAERMLKAASEAVSTANGVNSVARAQYKEWVKSQTMLSGGESAYSQIDDNGDVYRPVSMAWPNKKKAPADYFLPLVHPITGKPCPVPERGWRNPPATMKTLLDSGQILFGIDESTQPTRKYLLKDNMYEKIASLLYFAGSDDALLAAMGIPFDTPKPVDVAKRLIQSIAQGEDIVLDFFAGSGTTAHAVMELNAQDGASRRWISVQLPEPTADGSHAREKGFATISEIARKRIEIAAERILNNGDNKPVDTGFRSYTLQDTNFAKWQLGSDIDTTSLAQHLLELRDSAANEASPDALLSEILLKQGYSLTEKIISVEIGALDLRSVENGLVLAYLNEHVKPTLDQLRTIVEQVPARIIVLEDAFQGDDELKTNLAQLCKSKGIELWTA